MELFSSYIPSLKGSGNQRVGMCPFHEDRRPSFSVDVKEGLWICYAGCGEGNATQFAKRVGAINFKEGYQGTTFSPVERIKVIDDAHRSLFIAYHNCFMDDYLADANHKYGWTSHACIVGGVGYDEKKRCLVFGITDANGEIINIKWHKHYGIKGHNGNTIYPMFSFMRYIIEEPLYIFEGEKDVITAISQGVQAICFTAGAMSSIPKGYKGVIKRFKEVRIMYDNDEPGVKGLERVRGQLNGSS